MPHYKRRHFGHNQARHRLEAFLALHHARKAREVGFEKVLFVVLFGRVFQIGDHLVDVVFQQRNFALRFYRNGSRQIAFGHTCRHIGDRAHLNRQRVRHVVDVIGQILPGSRHVRHFRLSAEFAFGADFARHGRDMFGKLRKRIGHRVDRFGEGRNFAFGFHDEFLFQVAVRYRRHNFGDAAYLRRQV